mgnify:CR=1 FL=1
MARVEVFVPEDQIDDLSALMTNNRVRHVPVMQGDRLVGPFCALWLLPGWQEIMGLPVAEVAARARSDE